MNQFVGSMSPLRFIDLFAGMGGFHYALTQLGHECVFASEIDDELRDLYVRNFPAMRGRVFGDIRSAKAHIPEHDILCAGFPCQPFSKSGYQMGTMDETRGTLFHEILEILEAHKPRYVILENVGNFARHDSGRTWEIVRRKLIVLGYNVVGTEHVTPPSEFDWRDGKSRGGRVRQVLRAEGGGGLLSPHHFGEPHHRERFFAIAELARTSSLTLPERMHGSATSIGSIVQARKELTAADKLETCLATQQLECIELWNELIKSIPNEVDFPPSPIWGDEFLTPYPFTPLSPFRTPLSTLRECVGRRAKDLSRKEILALLPKYAQEEVTAFRQWKLDYIASNRAWWSSIRSYVPKQWRARLRALPPSLRKLEWNAKGGERDLWKYVLQFRPSGLRVKRPTSSPALVAMTVTQIPILGPQRRFLTRIEGLRLQGFPDNHLLPESRAAAFRALGNGVHVVVARMVAQALLGSNDTSSCMDKNRTTTASGGTDVRRVA